MHIAFGADDHYAQHLGITIASLLTNLKPGIEPHFYVVTDGFSDENKQKIALLQKIRPFSIQYFLVSIDDFANFPMNWKHVTIATYFRLKLPSLLPNLDKVLYMDIDTVVDGDVFPLWDTELSSDEWIGGALELEVKPEFCVTIGMQADDPYFNAGVLLMNLAALRNNHFEEKCIAFINQYSAAITYVDQDVVNHVCRGHTKLLDPKYNMVFSSYYHAHRLKSYKSPYSLQTLQNALANPVIIHFTGRQKPWYYASRHNLAYKYMDYIKLTPWKDYQYPDRNFKNFKSKNMFFMRQWIKRLTR